MIGRQGGISVFKRYLSSVSSIHRKRELCNLWDKYEQKKLYFPDTTPEEFGLPSPKPRMHWKDLQAALLEIISQNNNKLTFS